jgi:hypothetical protein
LIAAQNLCESAIMARLFQRSRSACGKNNDCAGAMPIFKYFRKIPAEA